jgi:hypothetical protein
VAPGTAFQSTCTSPEPPLVLATATTAAGTGPVGAVAVVVRGARGFVAVVLAAVVVVTVAAVIAGDVVDATLGRGACAVDVTATPVVVLGDRLTAGAVACARASAACRRAPPTHPAVAAPVSATATIRPMAGT